MRCQASDENHRHFPLYLATFGDKDDRVIAGPYIIRFANVVGIERCTVLHFLYCFFFIIFRDSRQSHMIPAPPKACISLNRLTLNLKSFVST